MTVMRTIEFANRNRHSLVGETGTPVELLVAELYLAPQQPIPPLRVVNPWFASGRSTMDMHTWTPFQVDEAEWSEIVASFAERSSAVAEPPDWVATPSDWGAWRTEVRFGIPAMQHLRASALDDWFNTRIREALDAGDEDLALELHVARITNAEVEEDTRAFNEAVRGERGG